MKNYLVIFIFSGIYFLGCVMKNISPLFYLVFLPIIIGVLTYKLIEGDGLLKRVLSAIIPLVSLFWIFIFLDYKNFLGVAVLHSALIGLLIVQIWEVCEWLLHGVIKVLKK